MRQFAGITRIFQRLRGAGSTNAAASRKQTFYCVSMGSDRLCIVRLNSPAKFGEYSRRILQYNTGHFDKEFFVAAKSNQSTFDIENWFGCTLNGHKQTTGNVPPGTRLLG